MNSLRLRKSAHPQQTAIMCSLRVKLPVGTRMSGGGLAIVFGLKLFGYHGFSLPLPANSLRGTCQSATLVSNPRDLNHAHKLLQNLITMIAQVVDSTKLSSAEIKLWGSRGSGI